MKKLHTLWLPILFLAGCATLHQATAVQTPPTTKILLVNTIQATSTGLPLTETPSPEPTVEPTWTLPATLLVPDSFSKINELLRTNGDCRLPCWWGITPGETKWEDARNILFPLAFKVHDGQSKSGDFLAGLGTRYGTYEGKPTGFNQDYVIRDGMIQAIQIQLPYPVPSPRLKDILANYGIPDEVYLGGLYAPEGLNTQSFWLYLYYSEQRIFVEYSPEGQPIQRQLPNGLLSACFSKIEYAELHVWGPDYSFDQTRDLILQNAGDPRQILEKVSNLTLDQFYKKFTNTDEEPCIDTPAKYWLR